MSAILLTPEALDIVQSIVKPEHYYADANRLIHEAALELHVSGRPIDVVSVAGVLRDRQKLQQVGGTPYLAQLADATPAVAHVEDHARTIRNKWRQRQIIMTAQRIAAEGYGDVGPLDDWALTIDERMLSATRLEEREEHLVILSDATMETIKIVQERQANKGVLLTGVTTGLPTLDARIGGLEAGNLYVLAARPGVGKTAAATGMVLACAKGLDPRPEAIGDGVVFISVEMPRHQLATRVIAQVARVDSVRLMRGQLTRAQWDQVLEAQKKIQRLPVAIEDSSDHTPASIRAAFRMGRRKIWERFGKHVNVKLCAIDYLQLLNSHTETNNREQEIGLLSRSTKALAKDEKIAVLSMAQVNRDCEKRTDKRPGLADLRESGTIEQDADIVIFLYREDYYRNKNDPKDGTAEFIVSKVRMLGSPGTVHCLFEPTTTTFYEDRKNPDLEQLGDIFDDYLPGTYGEPPPSPSASIPAALPPPPPHWMDERDD